MRHVNLARSARLEVLESRLLMSGPPEKFVIPVGGTPGVDWAITAYTDQDPAPDSARDYLGRAYTFDGSNTVHFALPDFATMNRGIDVYAAAAGTVVEAHDGEYDRNLSFINPAPVGARDNYVLIDHGYGWYTRYGRLRNGSVTASPGQVVTAGQKIAEVGGSGNPSPGAPTGYAQSSAYLRFTVMMDGNHVETFLEPDSFWHSPPPHAGSTPGLHNFAPTASLASVPEAWEGIS